MKYINSSEIVNDVKNRLSSYFSSNKVDDSIFPRAIKNCVDKMGIRILPEKCTVVEVVDCKAELPEDFSMMCLAFLCTNKRTYVPNPTKVIEQRLVCELDRCETVCDVCHDDCGNMFKIIEKKSFDAFEYTTFDLLKATKGCRPYCSDGCFNFKSRSCNEFEIKDERGQKVLLTNVSDGLIYIEYLADLSTEFDFMLPDHAYIRDWVFEELRREVYAYLYDQGEDVLQRLKHSERELPAKQHNARIYYSRNEVSDYYRLANRLARRYSNMERRIIHRPNITVYEC